jgi:hypothetical protein
MREKWFQMRALKIKTQKRPSGKEKGSVNDYNSAFVGVIRKLAHHIIMASCNYDQIL